MSPDVVPFRRPADATPANLAGAAVPPLPALPPSLATRASERPGELPWRLERLSHAGALDALCVEWEELLESSPGDGLFLTWDWLSTWWRHLGGGRQLRLLVVRRGGRLAAVAPLATGAGLLRRGIAAPLAGFLGAGQVGSDYLDVVARAGEEARSLRLVAAELDRDPAVIELHQLPRHGSSAEILVRELERRGWGVSRRVSHVCPYVELAQPSWEDYVATLGASHRANLRRRLRKLEERFTVELQRVEHEAELSGALDTLFELHHRRWAARGGSDGLGSTELMAFHRDFALAALRRGWLRLFVLRLDGRAVAALYGFRYHGRFLFYQSGFDPECAEHAVGMVLMAHAIRSAMEEGAREFDFLHGEEPYKYLWTTTSRQLARVELFPPGWRGRVEQRWRESRLAIKARVRGWLEERTSHPAEEPT